MSDSQPAPIKTQPPLIDIHNATVYRGRTRVFEDFSLLIEQGESVAILGPNGAGKTTLLRLLSRQIYPVVKTDSHVKLVGKERFSVWDYRRLIGVVSSDVEREYFHRRTGLQCVLTGYAPSLSINSPLLDIAPEQEQHAAAVMRRLHIEPLRDVKLANMSTGQQRRCLLARALVRNPRALIFDEPTAGLDFAAAVDYLHLVRDLVKDHRSIVIVTHHVNEIPPEVTRIVLLKAGRILADGHKQDVLTGENLTVLYDTEIAVIERKGHYVALPDR